MRPFLLASLIAYGAVLALALARRNRFLAIFAGVILGLHTLNSTLARARAERVRPGRRSAALVLPAHDLRLLFPVLPALRPGSLVPRVHQLAGLLVLGGRVPGPPLGV